VETADWQLFHVHNDDSVDVAVFPWAPPTDVVDYKFVSTKMFLTDEVIKEKSIGPGDEVFITGLFSRHSGNARNIPIVRMGNVAMMPDEPVPTSIGPMDAHLIEARSIGGLSGSPVFVRETRQFGLGNIYLLGLMHGHWDIAPKTINDMVVADEDRPGSSVNMGIAIVVPARKILEVINSPELADLRANAEGEYLKNKG
jgi:hypothetical protein